MGCHVVPRLKFPFSLPQPLCSCCWVPSQKSSSVASDCIGFVAIQNSTTESSPHCSKAIFASVVNKMELEEEDVSEEVGFYLDLLSVAVIEKVELAEEVLWNRNADVFHAAREQLLDFKKRDIAARIALNTAVSPYLGVECFLEETSIIDGGTIVPLKHPFKHPKEPFFREIGLILKHIRNSFLELNSYISTRQNHANMSSSLFVFFA